MFVCVSKRVLLHPLEGPNNLVRIREQGGDDSFFLGVDGPFVVVVMPFHKYLLQYVFYE